MLLLLLLLPGPRAQSLPGWEGGLWQPKGPPREAAGGAELELATSSLKLQQPEGYTGGCARRNLLQSCTFWPQGRQGRAISAWNCAGCRRLATLWLAQPGGWHAAGLPGGLSAELQGWKSRGPRRGQKQGGGGRGCSSTACRAAPAASMSGRLGQGINEAE